MSERYSAIELDPVDWQYSVGGQQPVDIRTRILTNAGQIEHLQPEDERIFGIPGYGEGDWAIENALERLTAMGREAIFAVVDTSDVPPTQLDITAFATEFGPNVVGELQYRGILPTRATAIGHSQGGGMLGLALATEPWRFWKVGFTEPIGHDTAMRKIKQPNPSRREREFKKQFAHVVTGPYLAHPRDLIMAGASIARQLKEDLLPPGNLRFNNKIALTVAEDAAPAVLAHAAAGNPVAYVFGRRDPLVTQEMVMGSLFALEGTTPDFWKGIANIGAVNTKYQHAYLGWPSGAHHLEIVLHVLNQRQQMINFRNKQNTNTIERAQ